MALVPCTVKGVFVISGAGSTIPLVVLTDGSGRVLPIFIGFAEAISISSAHAKEVPPRPFTHDLFIDVLSVFGISLHSLQIDSINDGVYYAQLVLVADHHEERIDCRPSDGIALALRKDAPLLVDDSVLTVAGQESIKDLPPMIEFGAYLKK